MSENPKAYRGPESVGVLTSPSDHFPSLRHRFSSSSLLSPLCRVGSLALPVGFGISPIAFLANIDCQLGPVAHFRITAVIQLDRMVFRKYSPDVKIMAVKMLRDGLPLQTINERLDKRVSRQSANRWLELYMRTRSVVVDPATYLPRGVRPKLSEEERQFLLEIIDHAPTLYLDELKKKLAELNIFVSESTIHRELRDRLGLSLKVARSVHPAQDMADRARYLLEVCKLPAEYLVFTDESSISQELQYRRNAWSLKGHRTARIPKVRDNRKFSLLPAVAQEGVIAAMVQEGAIIRLDFLHFLENHLLPMMNPYPGPLSVLICDNCKIHKGEQIKAMCVEKGVRFIFLPGYSPDLNPIEKAFGVLKSFLKRNGKLTGRPSDADMIKKYCGQIMNKKLMSSCYRNCGY